MIVGELVAHGYVVVDDSVVEVGVGIDSAVIAAYAGM